MVPLWHTGTHEAQLARAGVVLPKINVLLSKEHSFHKFFEASFQGSGQSAEIFRKLEEGGGLGIGDERGCWCAGGLQYTARGGLLSPGGKSEIITTLQKDT